MGCCVTEHYLCSLVDYIGQHRLHHAWSLNEGSRVHLDPEVEILLGLC